MTSMLGLTQPVLTPEPCPQAKPRVSCKALKQKKGVIYIHEHQSKSVVKIGRTTGDPNERLRHYSNTYSLNGFRFAHQIPVSKNLEIIERKIHQALRQRGYHLSMGNGAKEIFACSLEKAIAVAEYEVKLSMEGESSDQKIQKSKYSGYGVKSLSKGKLSNKNTKKPNYLGPTSFKHEFPDHARKWKSEISTKTHNRKIAVAYFLMHHPLAREKYADKNWNSMIHDLLT